jgi:V/A-type H+/Na+-transporting ATPase subunit F
MDPESDIIVVGSPEFITGFRLAGIRNTVPTDIPGMGRILVDLLESSSAGIIVLHDSDISELDPDIRERLWRSTKPVVVSIGSEPERDLRDKIKRTVGVDLFK